MPGPAFPVLWHLVFAEVIDRAFRKVDPGEGVVTSATDEGRAIDGGLSDE
ncbi:MAG: hypothetical protein ABFS37_05585 [Acidobacteriota bacterium]